MWEEEDLPGLEIKPVTPENNGWTKGYAIILSHSGIPFLVFKLHGMPRCKKEPRCMSHCTPQVPFWVGCGSPVARCRVSSVSSRYLTVLCRAVPIPPRGLLQ